MIRRAALGELQRLRVIETAAGEAFRLLGMQGIADDDPPSLDELAEYQRGGRAWVHADANEQPMAYILVDVIEGSAHIEQVSVHPEAAGRGIGRLLIEYVAQWAASNGFRRLTLSTFEQVPWNAPYYARFGFRVLPEPEWSEALREIVATERAHGLDAWPRVVMERRSA